MPAGARLKKRGVGIDGRWTTIAEPEGETVLTDGSPIVESGGGQVVERLEGL